MEADGDLDGHVLVFWQSIRLRVIHRKEEKADKEEFMDGFLEGRRELWVFVVNDGLGKSPIVKVNHTKENSGLIFGNVSGITC